MVIPEVWSADDIVISILTLFGGGGYWMFGKSSGSFSVFVTGDSGADGEGIESNSSETNF